MPLNFSAIDLSRQLIEALKDPAAYDHDVDRISVIETHISWVILTGIFAYKLKKPVCFSFADFSTLDKRLFYCEEEMRLNSRLAPELYLGVVAITGTHQRAHLNGRGPAIEYCVKMREFPQSGLLSYLSRHDQLSRQHIDQLSDKLARFHDSIESVRCDEKLGLPSDVDYWARDNFSEISTHLSTSREREKLDVLSNWSTAEYRSRLPSLKARWANGFIRECHGDMHLGNIALIEQQVTIFDGIDFNEQLRWIDVMNEVAFLTMDLCSRGHHGFANRFTNTYLEYTGDYSGLDVFRYYLVYRAMVRAKVAILRSGQSNLSTRELAGLKREYDAYIDLAARFVRDRPAGLIITHGLSGSGKSFVTQGLIEQFDAVRIRSDVERKRRAGLAPKASSHSKLGQGLYAAGSSDETYSSLADIAREILQAGFSVIVDASFLDPKYRSQFKTLASELGKPFAILACHASNDVLRQRVIARARPGDDEPRDPSEADLTVLNAQLENYQRLDDEHSRDVISLDTTGDVDYKSLAQEIIGRWRDGYH